MTDIEDLHDELTKILSDQIRKDIDEAIMRDIMGHSVGRYYRMDWFFKNTIEWEEL